MPEPFKIIQAPGEILFLYEVETIFRQIFTDGRKHPADPSPVWLGYSTGKWDGDTLVVDTLGFNDMSWLDARGTGHSEDMRVEERFHRRDFGHPANPGCRPAFQRAELAESRLRARLPAPQFQARAYLLNQSTVRCHARSAAALL